MIELIDAVVDKNTSKVKHLLKQGADPYFVIDASGLSAMHFAFQVCVHK